MKQKQKPRKPPRPLVVATAHTARGLAEAARLKRGAVDFVEVRLDLLRLPEAGLRNHLTAIKAPVLLTARHPAEGGAPGTTETQRCALLERFLPFAAALDVELRSARPLRPVMDMATVRGVVRILSFHDFAGTPSLPKLREIVRKAATGCADVVKIATYLRGPADLATLLHLQAKTSVPLATMGMGPLGRISRLVLVAAGSRLNYGYLDRPQVPGQWPAVELRDMLKRVMP